MTEAERWLKEHEYELPPEEIIDVQETYGWPIPQSVPHMDIFSSIVKPKEFNKIIGDPNNWEIIRVRSDLYKNWILPQAVILFGKRWFDLVKWRHHISKGVPFSLFSESEKKEVQQLGSKLEDTTKGRAIIIKIINKIDYVLDKYLEGRWFDGSTIKAPGGYIINSLKNEFIKELGAENGYKLVNIVACPYCLSNKFPMKVALTHHGSLQYSCPRCEQISKNLECDLTQYNEIELNRLKNAKIFKKFIGITCVCPSNNCHGKFVPLNSLDFSKIKISNNLINIGKILKTLSIPKHTFMEPPCNIRFLPLKCPYCNTKFTIDYALKQESGFKNRSGFLTTLPTISIWQQKSTAILDQTNEFESVCFKNKLASNYISLDDKIQTKQNIEILMNEIVFQMTQVKINSIAGLSTWCFYVAVLKWMEQYWQDAFKYFFGWSCHERQLTKKEKQHHLKMTKKKSTKIIRGQNPIHQTLFYIWVNIIDNNIKRFSKIDPKIKDLSDFKWFCFYPKFSGGPMSNFRSEVNDRLKILNNTKIISLKDKFNPRLAKIYSIYKIVNGKIDRSYNFVNDIKFCEWQSIQMKECELKPGDLVKIRALMMPGHPTHAPIQRILRLRTKVLAPIINKIKQEEKTGQRDVKFWDAWQNKVSRAKIIIKERINERT